MSELGIKAYRFSISWPRVIPEGKGKINYKGLDFYDRLVDKLLEKKIIPFVDLYHWDLPQALEDEGGWRKKETSYSFAEYTKVIINKLSDRVNNWITFNEMPCIALLGYRDGIHAPGAKESPKIVNQVIHNLFLAHGLAIQTIRKYSKNTAEIGLVHNFDVKIPVPESENNINLIKNIVWYDSNDWLGGNAWWFDPIFKGSYPENIWKEKGKDVPEITGQEMKIISTPIDFLGLNIYTGTRIKASKTKTYEVIPYPKRHPKTTYGWNINPDCIYWGLKIVNDLYKIKKFYITENGCSLNDKLTKDGKIHDNNRIKYLHDHIVSAYRAISDGINLKGYFIWSLMDNFEVNWGYSKRFGLIYIDNKTLKRIFKDSAFWFSDVIRKNGLCK
jgi:beta-glucosidase